MWRERRRIIEEEGRREEEIEEKIDIGEERVNYIGRDYNGEEEEMEKEGSK